MISAGILTDLNFLIASVNAAAPLTSATRLTLNALQIAGSALLAKLDVALPGASGRLDAADPTGFPADLVNDLLALATASEDQSTLADMRGLVGRATFNIAQAGNA